MPMTTSAVDLEMVRRMRDRPDFYRPKADRVNDIARRLIAQGKGFGGRKAFLADVAGQLGYTTRDMAATFLAWNNLGWVELARADLPGSFDASKVAASEIRTGDATYNFLVVDASARQNPAWTARAVLVDWNEMLERVGPQWMPTLEPERAARGKLTVSIDELGCGAYGCVIETNDPGVVLKMTTDAHEAVFATEILPSAPPEARAGVVEYLDALELQTAHRRHPIVALWRRAAQNVGHLEQVYSGGALRRYEQLVNASWDQASIALQLLVAADDRSGELYEDALKVPPRDARTIPRTPAEQLAAALDSFRARAIEMQGTPLARIGAALVAFLERGILLADVHTGNLGQVPDKESGELVWVITDPGNAIVLPEPWRS